MLSTKVPQSLLVRTKNLKTMIEILKLLKTLLKLRLKKKNQIDSLEALSILLVKSTTIRELYFRAHTSL